MLHRITNPPAVTLTDKCDQLKAAYTTCKNNGDDVGALNAYIDLHQIEDGY